MHLVHYMSNPVPKSHWILEGRKVSNSHGIAEAEQYGAAFWPVLDKLVSDSQIIIDRPKGSQHPKNTKLFYAVDYSYLENTSSMDRGGIDVWKGTNGEDIDAIICTVDLMKRDSEIKILIGCSESEKRLVMEFHNHSECMKGILIRRNAQ
jgi:inorganic pyrophosphatase